MNKLDRYFVIYPYSFFGQNMMDLKLTSEFDILCVNPEYYIKDGTKIEVIKNSNSAICTIKHIKKSIPNGFTKGMHFLCSDKVSSILGLDVDGDIALIKES